MVWFLRKWFWIFIAWFKAAMNKPLDIPLPGPQGAPIQPVPLCEAVPGLPGKVAREIHDQLNRIG